MRDLYDSAYFKARRKYMVEPLRYLTYAAALMSEGVNSVVDVGCGANTLAKYLRQLGLNATGVDFSVDSDADVIASCDCLPFGNAEFDMAITTDLLEHLEVETVHRTIMELKRVAERQAHFICFEAAHGKDDDDYHLTLESRAWWLNQFSEHDLYVRKEIACFENSNISPMSAFLTGRNIAYLMIF